jgi:pSer/pThr/pTyr-binding forkhead associated (FHA) protein
MSALTVTLTMANGPLVGREYEFRDAAVYVLGRDPECHPRLPDELVYKDISRHHCLLSVQLPDLRLLDLGSTNGTFVNGARVGHPASPDPVPECDPAATIAFHADPTGWHPLEDGDVIALAGNIVLIVRVQVRGEASKPLPGRRQHRDGAAGPLPGGRRHDRLSLSHSLGEHIRIT